MSDHIQSAIDQLEVELEAIDQKRGDIEHAIGALTRLQREGLTTTGNGAGGTPSSKRSKKVESVKRAKPPASAKTDKVDQQLQEIGDRIVAVLRTKSPQRVGDVLKAAKVKGDRSKITRLMMKLAEAGRITRSGVGRGAMVSLPGTARARGDL
jgi:hypothetical protein